MGGGYIYLYKKLFKNSGEVSTLKKNPIYQCDISPPTVTDDGDPLGSSSFTLEECRKLWTLHSETPC